jgi:prepilin-type N-terminal cleavage/methylation domain-containing protein
MTYPRRPRGFTLIELMVVVAIVGLLASVALPTFQKFVLRAKVAERATIMLRIRKGIQDYYIRNGVLFPSSYGESLVSGYNPPFPPTSGKRVMTTTFPTWNVYFSGAGSVFEEIEGAVYYSYAFQVDDVAGEPTRISIWAAGDLDGDGAYAYKSMTWEGLNGVQQLVDEYPAAGEEDDHGPWLTF